MLGFDLDAPQIVRQLSAWDQSCPAESEEIRQSENDILNIFVDICSLFQREPEMDHPSAREEPKRQAYLFSYLRMVETNGEGLPPDFVAAVRRALAHYGVDALDGSPRLKESLLWIWKSHQRMDSQTAAILAILERRMRHAQSREPHANGSFRTLLDRMVAITDEPYPSVSDLARELRYRYFDQPLFEKARTTGLHGCGKTTGLSRGSSCRAGPPREDPRACRVSAVAGWFVRGPIPIGRRILAHTRCRKRSPGRYYRNCSLLNSHSSVVDGHPYFSAEYDLRGHTDGDFRGVCGVRPTCGSGAGMSPMIAQVPRQTMMSSSIFMLAIPAKLSDPDSTQREVQSMLNQVVFPRAIRRIVVSVAGTEPGTSRKRRCSTSPTSTAEMPMPKTQFYRGLHPMMGNACISGGSAISRLIAFRQSKTSIFCMPLPATIRKMNACSRPPKCAT